MRGADFVRGLRKHRWAAVLQKGTDPDVDSYSGFRQRQTTRHRPRRLPQGERQAGVRILTAEKVFVASTRAEALKRPASQCEPAYGIV